MKDYFDKFEFWNENVCLDAIKFIKDDSDKSLYLDYIERSLNMGHITQWYFDYLYESVVDWR